MIKKASTTFVESLIKNWAVTLTLVGFISVSSVNAYREKEFRERSERSDSLLVKTLTIINETQKELKHNLNEMNDKQNEVIDGYNGLAKSFVKHVADDKEIQTNIFDRLDGLQIEIKKNFISIQ